MYSYKQLSIPTQKDSHIVLLRENQYVELPEFVWFQYVHANILNLAYKLHILYA